MRHPSTPECRGTSMGVEIDGQRVGTVGDKGDSTVWGALYTSQVRTTTPYPVFRASPPYNPTYAVYPRLPNLPGSPVREVSIYPSRVLLPTTVESPQTSSDRRYQPQLSLSETILTEGTSLPRFPCNGRLCLITSTRVPTVAPESRSSLTTRNP